MTKKRASKIDRKLTTPDKPRRPRSQDLPGLEERAIKPLEDVAAEYADIRDRRMELTKEESELKQRALTLMHKYQRTAYVRDGVEIRIVSGEEKIAVKIRKHDDDENDDESSSDEHVEMTGDDERS